MPQTANDAAALITDLKSRLDRLVQTALAEGRAQALSEIRSLVGEDVPAKRGPSRPRKSVDAPAAKPRKARKNSWAGLSAVDRLARVNAIRKGKGLPPRGE